MKFYVDDSLPFKGSYDVPVTGGNAIRPGSGLSSPDNLTVHYDDILIYREISSANRPAEIDSHGPVTTFEDAGEGVLNASYTENGNTQTDSLNITITDETTISDRYFY